MKRWEIKISKKVLVISILISLILLASMIVYALDAWNQGYRLDQETITIHYGDATGATSPTASCYSLTNTNANDYFVPTKTSGEMSSFISHKPAGVTSASAVVNGGCTWSACTATPNCAGRCGNIVTSGTQTCTCNNPSPSCGGSACPSTQTCTYDYACFCPSGSQCNINTWLCEVCACIGQDLVLCGSTYAGNCGLTCSGTKCPSAYNVPCGTTYTGCGCAVGGQQCSSGTCNYCSTSKGCVCDGSDCAYDYGQYYCS